MHLQTKKMNTSGMYRPFRDKWLGVKWLDELQARTQVMGLNPALHSTCFLREKSGTADWCGLPDFDFFFCYFWHHSYDRKLSPSRGQNWRWWAFYSSELVIVRFPFNHEFSAKLFFLIKLQFQPIDCSDNDIHSKEPQNEVSSIGVGQWWFWRYVVANKVASQLF